jgi:putative DNA primase/helicase
MTHQRERPPDDITKEGRNEDSNATQDTVLKTAEATLADTEAMLKARGFDPNAVTQTVYGPANKATVSELRRELDYKAKMEELGFSTDPAPLPSGLPPVDTFPLSSLPDSFRGWITDVADRMQCPPDFVAIPAIVAAGSLIGRSVGIHPKRRDDWLVIPNLWGLIVGRPSAKKSPAMEEALRPLRALEAEAREGFKDRAAQHAIELEVSKAQRDSKRATLKVKTLTEEGIRSIVEGLAAIVDPEAPVAVRYAVSDTTTEKLAELLATSERGLLQVRDELAGWLHSFEKPGRESDRAFYLEGWSGLSSFTVDRIGRGTLHVPAVTLAVLGTTQPGKIQPIVQAAVTGGTQDDGLPQRFSLATWPDHTKVFKNVDRFPNSTAREAYSAAFRGLATLTPEKAGAITGETALRFSEEAQAVFDAWYEAHGNRVRSNEIGSPALESHLGKFDKMVPAIALIFYLVDLVSGFDLPGSVPLRQIERAIQLAKYFESHARRLYGAAEAPGISGARSLLRHSGDLLKGDPPKDRFTLRDVYRNQWSGLSDKALAGSAVSTLLDYGYLRENDETTGGRTTKSYTFHPKALDSDFSDCGEKSTDTTDKGTNETGGTVTDTTDTTDEGGGCVSCVSEFPPNI